MKNTHDLTLSFPRRREPIRFSQWQCVMGSHLRGKDTVGFVRVALNRVNTGALAFGLAFVALGSASAAFPGKPFRIIVPSDAGGPAELCMRAVVAAMRAGLGQHFVIENAMAM